MNACSSSANAVRPTNEKGSVRVGEIDVEGPNDGEDITAEVRRPKKIADPKKPSEDEVREHELTHLPFRSWCWTCVHGRGRSMPHRRKEDERGLPEIHMDFAFLGDRDKSGETRPCLVVREAATRMTMATMLPDKTGDRFVVDRILAFLSEIGYFHGDVIAKSDQEPAMKRILDEVGKERAARGGGKWIVEHSPVGASQANGVAERAIQSVQGQVRVLKLAAEKKWGIEIPAEHPAIAWIVEYAAFLLNRFEVGHDGKTAYERLKGKKATTLGIEFGEAVHWKSVPAGGALGKLSSTWRDGVYLGVKGKTGEIIIGNLAGVWRTRTVQRKPEDERWDRKNVEFVRMQPYDKESRNDKERSPEQLPVAIRMPDAEAEEEDVQSQTREAVPRNLYIRKGDLDRHGYSAGCPGCLSILRGKARQAHSTACRKRFEELLSNTDRFKEANERINRYLVRKLEQQDAERDRETKLGRKETAAGEKGDQNMEGIEKDEAHKPDANAGASSSDDRKGSSEEMIDEEPGAKVPKRSHGGDGGEGAPGGVGGAASSGHELKRQKVSVATASPTWDDVDAVEPDEAEYEVEVADDTYDGKTGELLSPELVNEARKEELGFMRQIELYDEVPLSECWEATGKPPIDTRWVDVNKGTVDDPDLRCRLVARDFKPKGERDRGDLFAAMPPLEAKKLLFHRAAMQKPQWRGGRWQKQKLMFVDIKKAHLNGKVGENEAAFISLPEGCCAPGMCGRLRRWLYGMRPAASAWEQDYSEKLAEVGMAKGRSAPTAFYDKDRCLRCVVHGDDFTFLGWEEHLDEAAGFLRKHYKLKVRGIMGGEPRDSQEIRILNRKLSWIGGTMMYEADDKHQEIICNSLGLKDDSKGLEKPAVRETAEQIADENLNEPLSPEEATKFRATAARANYLSADRPDIGFAVKELCRDMAAPTSGSQAKLKRVGRYLIQYPKLQWEFGGGGEAKGDDDTLHVYTDSDWAGCPRTRRSTSGGLVLLSGVAVKHWSSTQPSVALSSGEAEYVALVKAASEGLGVQALARDLGWDFKLVVYTDSSTARAVANRTGAGKIRHMETRLLWVQDAVKCGRFALATVRGASNPADVLTKPQSLQEMSEALHAMGACVVGRSAQSWGS